MRAIKTDTKAITVTMDGKECQTVKMTGNLIKYQQHAAIVAVVAKNIMR